MADSRSTTATSRFEPADRSGSAGRFDPDEHPLCTDPAAPLEVTCYVRGDVSAPSERRIESVRHRLDALSGTRLVETARTRRWPPRRHASDPGSDAETCDALVDRFERWADDAGCSLRPAVRRRARRSLLGDDPSDPRVCVPVVLLAFEPAAPEASGVAGVVPYTLEADDGAARTYTVADWLAAAERAVGADTGDPGTRERVRPGSRGA